MAKALDRRELASRPSRRVITPLDILGTLGRRCNVRCMRAVQRFEAFQSRDLKGEGCVSMPAEYNCVDAFLVVARDVTDIRGREIEASLVFQGPGTCESISLMAWNGKETYKVSPDVFLFARLRLRSSFSRRNRRSMTSTSTNLPESDRSGEEVGVLHRSDVSAWLLTPPLSEHACAALDAYFWLWSGFGRHGRRLSAPVRYLHDASARMQFEHGSSPLH